MKKYLFYFLLLVPLVVFAASTSITTSGNWNDPGIWSGGNIGDNIADDVDFFDSQVNVTIQSGDLYII